MNLHQLSNCFSVARSSRTRAGGGRRAIALSSLLASRALLQRRNRTKWKKAWSQSRMSPQRRKRESSSW